jgi:hypothetical protein
VKVKISGVETASYNDFYVLILPPPGQPEEPIRLYFFQNQIPEIGTEWIFGPLRFQQELDFQIFSRILLERTPYNPHRPGMVTEMGFQHWQIKFEDWCDEDWDDLIVDITLEPASPSIVIMRPSDMMSFITDNYETYSVAAEAYAWDIEGNDISDGIDWWVISGDSSGECNPAYLIDSRTFHFIASIEPRDIRGAGPLEYRIRATVNPYILPLSDVNRIIQDDIDTVRQQYIDYHLKLPYKSQFVIAVPIEIPAEYRTILYDIFEATRSAYRIWADNPSAYFVVSSGYRTPEKNRNLKPKPGKKTSMHQYHWAIDMDFGDEGVLGTEDDLEFLRRYLREYLRHPFYEFFEAYEGHVHIELFNYSEEFPGIER